MANSSDMDVPSGFLHMSPEAFKMASPHKLICSLKPIRSQWALPGWCCELVELLRTTCAVQMIGKKRLSQNPKINSWDAMTCSEPQSSLAPVKSFWVFFNNCKTSKIEGLVDVPRVTSFIIPLPLSSLFFFFKSVMFAGRMQQLSCSPTIPCHLSTFCTTCGFFHWPSSPLVLLLRSWEVDDARWFFHCHHLISFLLPWPSDNLWPSVQTIHLWTCPFALAASTTTIRTLVLPVLWALIDHFCDEALNPFILIWFSSACWRAVARLCQILMHCIVFHHHNNQTASQLETAWVDAVGLKVHWSLWSFAWTAVIMEEELLVNVTDESLNPSLRKKKDTWKGILLKHSVLFVEETDMSATKTSMDCMWSPTMSMTHGTPQWKRQRMTGAMSRLISPNSLPRLRHTAQKLQWQRGNGCTSKSGKQKVGTNSSTHCHLSIYFVNPLRPARWTHVNWLWTWPLQTNLLWINSGVMNGVPAINLKSCGHGKLHTCHSECHGQLPPIHSTPLACSNPNVLNGAKTNGPLAQLNFKLSPQHKHTTFFKCELLCITGSERHEQESRGHQGIQKGLTTHVDIRSRCRALALVGPQPARCHSMKPLSMDQGLSEESCGQSLSARRRCATFPDSLLRTMWMLRTFWLRLSDSLCAKEGSLSWKNPSSVNASRRLAS